MSIHKFDEWHDPAANTMEELMSRELAVLKLGLERRFVPSFRLMHSHVAGRGLFATRMIECGEMVMEESPAVSGPKPDEMAHCLSCCNTLTELESVVLCKDCSLHFCSGQCATASQHKRECKEMAKLSFDTSSLESMAKTGTIILPLRCLLLPDTEPQNWARVSLLQNHLEERKHSSVQKLNQNFLVKFIRDVGFSEGDASDHDVHRVCGILDSNTFEGSNGGERSIFRCLYPLAAMANSSCLPNLTHVNTVSGEGNKLRLVATREIQEGEEMLVCYTGIRWGRSVRRKHLQMTKYFLCTCARCVDPTDAGTYVSAIRCQDCGGNVISTVGGNQDVESSEDSNWECEDCRVKVPSKKVVAVETLLGQLLKKIRKDDPRCLEALSKKCEKLLGCNHYILLEVRLTLVSLYQDININHGRVVELVSGLLPVLERLEGESKAVLSLRFSKLEAELNLIRSGEEKVPSCEWFTAAFQEFNKISKLLKHDCQVSSHKLQTIGAKLKTIAGTATALTPEQIKIILEDDTSFMTRDAPDQSVALPASEKAM